MSSGQYLSGERGTGASFTITRMRSPPKEHDNTMLMRDNQDRMALIESDGLTLELDISRETCDLMRDEGPCLWYVIVWQWPSCGESRKIERSQDWGAAISGHTKRGYCGKIEIHC